MTPRIITFSYRKTIDASSTRAWDQLVFEDSYRELLMQAQLYNQEKKYRTFADLLQYSAGAQQLHFLVSAAVIPYLRQLKEIIPDVTNNLGISFLKFSKYQFEIVSSDLLDKQKHQVAFNFYSEPILWHDTIGEYLLISDNTIREGEVRTHLLHLQPGLSIYSLKTPL